MVTSEQWANIGVNGLDEVLGGGLPRGQLYLIRGASGVGKTTLGLQFLIEGARNGEAVLYLGTSETESEIRRIARSHGWPLDGVTLYHHEHHLDMVEQTMLHPADVELPQTMATLLSVVDRIAPSRVVVDSLAEIRMLARDELWYRRQLMILKQHFAGGRCTVLLIEMPHPNQMPLDSVVSGVIELMQSSSPYGADQRRLRVTKVRGQPFVTGYHDYRIATGGLAAYPRLVAAEHRQSIPTELVSTGLAELDVLAAGGLTRGTSCLLLGPSGTGKSALATQLVVAAAERGERSVFYVFDERMQTLFQRADSIGLPLRRFVDDGLIEIKQVDPAELSSGEFSHLTRQGIEERGIRFVVIDSLNGYAYAMPEERSLGVYLHELSSYLGQKGVTPIYTMTQHGLLTSHATQPFDLSYIADTVLLLRHFEFAGCVHKALSVYKNRSGPHETSIREFRIDAGGLRLGRPLTQFQGILSGMPKFLGEDLNDLG